MFFRFVQVCLLCSSPTLVAVAQPPQVVDVRLADLAALVAPTASLRDDEIRAFVAALPEDRRADFVRRCGLSPSTAPLAARRALDDADAFVQEFRRRTVRWWSRPAVGEALDWDVETRRVAACLGVDAGGANSFELEHRIVAKSLADAWDSMPAAQREALLREFARAHPELRIDPAAAAAMSGAAILGSGIGASAAIGFSFYTMMSATIAATAGSIGVTVPFGVYVVNSTFWGVATGPIGWGITGVLGGIAVWRLSAVDPGTAVPLVVHVHALRVEAIEAAAAREKSRDVVATHHWWWVAAGLGASALACAPLLRRRAARSAVNRGE